jgi:hypothetical protein
VLAWSMLVAAAIIFFLGLGRKPAATTETAQV